MCISTAIYSRTIDLDPGNSGMILSWQRCCRNDKIDNIINPGSSGFTAWTKIPPSRIPNNSAFFKEVPPIYVCVNAPLSVDQSALDLDGDSLVYSFNTPYLGGADQPAERRRPESLDTYEAPPFRQAQWIGGYSQQTQMIGAPTLNINSSTGEITITPTRLGTFTVGIKVDEYRDGVLVGTTFRDYQYTVIDCQFDVLANFTIPNGTTVDGSYTFECGDTVNITNISVLRSGLNAKFFWDFGDPNTTSDTITTFDKSVPVSYIYPGNGNYTITLTATSSICTDEYKYNVRIRSTRGFTLGPDRIFCDSVRYILDTKASDAVAVTWNTGQSGSSILARDSGTFIATVDYGKCDYKDTVHLSISDIPKLDLPEDLLMCDSIFTITLDAGFPDLLYEWKTPGLQNTRTIEVSDTGIYTLKMSNTNCSSYDTTRIWQATQPRFGDTLFCNEFEYQLDLGNIEEASILWSDGSVLPTNAFIEPGKYWVTVTQRDCIKHDTFEISNSFVSVELGEDEHFCDTMNILLDGGPDGPTYEWSTGATSRTIRVNYPDTFSVVVTNPEGCTLGDTVIYTLTQSPTVYAGEDTTICVNSPTEIGTSDPFTQYQWNTGQNTSRILVTRENNYKLTVTDEFGCTAEDSVLITVDPTALPDVLYIPNAFTPNQDGRNEWFPYSEEVIQPAFLVRVYSRWGEKIFDSEEQGTTKWDGQYKGELVPTGVYVYFVSYRGCDGNARTDKGTLHVIY